MSMLDGQGSGSLRQVLSRLKQEGWALDEQAALAFLSDAFPGGEPPSAAAAAEALLNADLRQLGGGGLPADVNRAAAAKLAGPIVVQVSEARDIAQPSRTASESDERRGRLLRLALTDGKARCAGLELQPLPLSAEQLVPGTKLVLSGVTVRLGVLLLEPRNVRLLGGRVDALAEAWETQRRYGGTAVERPDAADAERPPPFRHFDPKRAKYGTRRGAAARAAASPAGQPASVAPAAAAAAAESARPPPQGQQQQAEQRGAPQREGRLRRGAQPYQPPAARQQPAQPQVPPLAAPQDEQARRLQLPPARRGTASEVPLPQSTGGHGRSSQLAAPADPAGHPRQAPPAVAPAAGKPGGAGPAAAQKLLERLQVEEGRHGRGQPRRRRRGRYDDDDEDDGSMTLEEWEARQKGGAAPGGSAGGGGGPVALDAGQQQQGQPLSDEELARQLQRQLDLEAAAEWGTPLGGAPPHDELAASLQAMFVYGGGREGGQESGGRRGGGGGGRGRGRGRRR